MPTESGATRGYQRSGPAYFDTPEWIERMQLVLHLLYNAEETPFLRAPAGAGKTRFAGRLGEELGEDFILASLDGSEIGNLQAALSALLGLQQESAGAADLVAAAERPLLLVVDNADALESKALDALFGLRQAGARVLFVGRGDSLPVRGDWRVQYVDLPAFSEAQSQAFLRGLAESGKVDISEDAAVELHRRAAGLPGGMLEEIAKLSKKPVRTREGLIKPLGLSPWMLLGAGFLAVLLVLGLVFQESINRLFEPPVSEQAALPIADSERAGKEVTEGVSTKLVDLSAPQLLDANLSVEGGSLTPGGRVAVPMEAGAVVEEGGVELEEVTVETGGDPVLEEASTAIPETDVPSLASSGIGEHPGPDVALEDPDEEQGSDPVLDAVIDAAIAAAGQPLESAAEESVQAADAGQAPERAISPQEDAPQPQPEPKQQAPVAEPVAAIQKPAREQDDTGWLRARAPGDYTLQLVGARDRGSLKKFVERYQIPSPHAVFERDLDGKPWFSLIAGVYPDRDAALAARSRLPAPLNSSDTWPRTFGSIQAQMK